MMSELLPDIAKFVGLVLSYSAYKWYEKVQAQKAKAKELKHKPESFIGDVRNGIEIELILAEIKGRIGCDRVHILGYSNGEKSFSGFSFKYISMLFELNDLKYARFLQFFQRVPIGNFLALVNQIHEEGVVFVPENDPTIMGDLHRQYGIKCAWKFRIGDHIANGSLSLSWHEKEVKLTDKQIESVKIDTLRIRELMKPI